PNEEAIQQLYIDPKEAKQASDIMTEALDFAQKHAEHTNDYKEYSKQDGVVLYFKKFKDTEIGKLELTIPNPDSYDDVVSMLWDPNGAKNFDDKFIKGSIYRVYDQNLVIIQQRYKSLIRSWQRYYHALANKIELSKNKTAIVLVSSDMNDHDEAIQQLYIDPKEAKQASDIMTEALDFAQKHAEHTNDYKEYSKQDGVVLYFKKFKDTEIGKLELTIPNPDSYDDVVSMLWDPNGAKNFDDKFIKGSIYRVYDQNLVIIQQRYKSLIRSWQRYYHALANKIELSKNKTAIVLVSSDMNDHDGGKNKKYVNPFVESANSFKPDIDSEEDIRNGDLYKMYINLVAF
ncbi:Acidic phosphoprotein precursor PCEMA1, putative, partial [Plasmodium berghei]